MTASPGPTWVFHFTDVAHLPSIVRDGLVADRQVDTRLLREAGQPRIKSQRRERVVPIPPGGVVADYVPFYFAPRSPMMYAISRGRVAGYGPGCDRLVYLCTTLEELEDSGATVIGTDVNAALRYAQFVAGAARVRDQVDMELMRAPLWRNTEEDPDRRARRMAECLVHRSVPWSMIRFVGAHNESVAAEIVALGCPVPRLEIKPNWYF